MLNPTQTPWTPLSPPALDWRDDVPVAQTSGDIYFSTEDGLAESDYVFIEGNDLPARWSSSGVERSFVIAEVGFGTGLNACLTIARWLKDRSEGGTLHYIGVEHAPLQQQDVERALARWPELLPVASALQSRWPDPIPGCHRRHFAQWGVTLDFWWGDAACVLEDLASHGRRWVDAWYLDGFAPAREAGPWQQAVYTAMAALSLPGATFSTFTAAGDVRRGLEAAGFSVSKRAGFGSKRDALCGFIGNPTQASPPITPWDLNPTPRKPAHAMVIGAGLAGAHAAHALATRGIAVTVLEAATHASGGSSNLQGVTYTRLSHQHNPLTDFSVSAFAYAADHYEALAGSGALEPGVDYGWGGYIQLDDDEDTLGHLSKVLPLAPDFAQVLDKQEIAALIGAQPRCGGIHYLRGGWLNPRAVCRALLAHPAITLTEGAGAVQLTPSEGQWQALDLSGNPIAEAPLAVLATAYGVTMHTALAWLPLTSIRGQTTHLPATDQLSDLQVALCDSGYLPPARSGQHCMGASFIPGDPSTDERAAEHAHNVDMMRTALPDLNLNSPEAGWRGHVAHRCNSNDYLPVAGVVPDLPAFNTQYDALRHDRKRPINAACPVLPGLAVVTSLGSRGLSAAPLAAEVLADQLCGGPPAVPRYLQRAISPARFAERALKRGEPL